jgi:hypothetical protein
MVGTTAQLVALSCHFNSLIRGIATDPFFPGNSTCQFCEYIRFVRPPLGSSGHSASWTTVANTPDEWLAREARPGRSALLVHDRVDDPRFPDRMSAGFVGGGGRWLLALTAHGRMDAWEANWEVGNQEAADQRIWRVRYGLVAENAELALPTLRTLDVLRLALRQTLSEILAFAEEHQIEGFAGCFRNAIQCLSATDPFEPVYHDDLAPTGLLDLPAKQMLAACQAAWVFGGMGSWNDLGFDGAEQTRYQALSDSLFTLLNEGICASANSSAAHGT